MCLLVKSIDVGFVGVVFVVFVGERHELVDVREERPLDKVKSLSVHLLPPVLNARLGLSFLEPLELFVFVDVYRSPQQSFFLTVPQSCVVWAPVELWIDVLEF